MQLSTVLLRTSGVALKIRNAVAKAVTLIHLDAHGIKRPRRLRVYGRPIVSLYPGSEINIGDNVVMCSDSRSTALGVSRPVIIRTLLAGAEVSIGSDCGLSGTVICAASRIEIGERCLFGADVTIADTDFHPVSPARNRRRAPIPTPGSADRVQIGNDVFIGAGAQILKGVTIGDGAVIGAMSVVVHNVPNCAVYAGNPARSIGTVDPT